MDRVDTNKAQRLGAYEVDDALAIAEQVDVRRTRAERTCSARPPSAASGQRTDGRQQAPGADAWQLNRSVRRPAPRSLRPSAYRYSIATVRFSIQPSSPSRRKNVAVNLLMAAGVAGARNPMVGTSPAVARARRAGNAAAPPSSVMKWQRPMSDMGTSPRAAFRIFSLSQRVPQVLGQTSPWANKSLGKPELS